MSGQFDTSGVVRIARGKSGILAAKRVRWSDLDPFTQGYVEAVFTAQNPADPFDGYGLRRPVRAGPTLGSSIIAWMPLGFSDLAPETLARIMEDCAELAKVFAAYRVPTADDGKTYWELRQRGHLPKDPPLTPTLGDDGKVYLSTPSDVLSCLEVGS